MNSKASTGRVALDRALVTFEFNDNGVGARLHLELDGAGHFAGPGLSRIRGGGHHTAFADDRAIPNLIGADLERAVRLDLAGPGLTGLGGLVARWLLGDGGKLYQAFG